MKSVIFCLTIASLLTFGNSFAIAEDIPRDTVKELIENLHANDDLKEGFLNNDSNREGLYRIHKDAYYHLVLFFDNGSVVQLHDGSKWSVKSSQQDIVFDWVQNDDIFIKPYSSCFSSKKYVLCNFKRDRKNQVIEVDLLSPPLPMGQATFHIVSIEASARFVQLSDNTIWQIDPKDSQFPKWEIGQRILVGVNNSYRTAQYPHILINADISSEPFSKADFYGYPVGY